MLIFYKRHFPKRYFYYECAKETISQKIRIFIKKILGKDYSSNIMKIVGIQDAQMGKLGLHEIYRPGWKK